ncbi:MAG: DUF6440 family protein [Oscillospiraceae bacterium]|nr:DUF6440 family protein [Oscillospiraceae bacterium]
MSKKDKRFEIVTKESHGMAIGTMILRDKHTGIHYLFSQAGYGGGLTPLLDSDGKPMIDKG